MNQLWIPLVDWAAKATVVILIASLLSLLFKGRPRLRRMIWAYAFVCALLLPFANGLRQSDSVLIHVVSDSNVFKATPQTAFGMLGSWTLLIWLVGMVSTTLWFAAGYISLARVNKRSRPYCANLSNTLNHDVHRQWRLRITDSPSVRTAITFGLFRPVILLPATAEEWSDGELHLVLLHELEHIRSFDYLVQVIAQIQCAILWFNPAVWLASNALRAECEANADEAVIEAGIKASDYAALLLGFAANLAGRGAHHPALSIVRTNYIQRRICAIVRISTHRYRPLTARDRFSGILVAAVLILAMGSVRLAKAQSQTAPTFHSQEWLRGYAQGKAYATAHPYSGRDGSPGLSADERREIELRAIRDQKPPPQL